MIHIFCYPILSAYCLASARQERDDLKVDVDSLRKRLETAERERAFSLGDAHEAQRQRDAAQAQVVEAVEEGERREKQRRAALARAQQAEDAAAVAQRARKEVCLFAIFYSHQLRHFVFCTQVLGIINIGTFFPFLCFTID